MHAYEFALSYTLPDPMERGERMSKETTHGVCAPSLRDALSLLLCQSHHTVSDLHIEHAWQDARPLSRARVSVLDRHIQP